MAEKSPVRAPLEAVPAKNTPDFTDADAKQVAHILNLQIAGWTLDEVAAATKMSREAVEDLLLRHQRRFVKNQKELVAHMRGLASDRLDRLLKSVWADATDDESPKQFAAQDRALRNIEQQRKLWGLDAPAQVEISHRPSDEAVADLVTKVSAVITGVPLEDDDVLELDPDDYAEVVEEQGAGHEGDGDRAGDGGPDFDAEGALDVVAHARAATQDALVSSGDDVPAAADPDQVKER